MNILSQETGGRLPRDLKDAIDQASWTVQGRSHVFYTNPDYSRFLWNDNKGHAFLESGLITIEDTPGWSIVKSYQYEFDPSLRDIATQYASLKFAEAAKGPVYAMVHGSTEAPLFAWSRRDSSQPPNPKIRPTGIARSLRDSVWLSTELPIILKNHSITHINDIPMNEIRSYMKRMESSESALRRISHDVGLAALTLPNHIKFGTGGPGSSPASVDQSRESKAIDTSLPEIVKATANIRPFNPISAMKNGMLNYGKIPGGILSSAIAELPLNIETLVLNKKGQLVINKSVVLDTALNAEELLILLDSATSINDTKSFGALSGSETIGVNKNTIVGSRLLAADRVLHELGSGWIPDLPHLHQAKVPNCLESVLSKLKNRDSKTIAIETACASLEKARGIVIEVSKFAFEEVNGSLRVEAYDMTLGSFSLGARIPGLFSPLVNSEEELHSLGIENFKQVKYLRENFTSILRQEPLLAKAFDYLAVMSVLRQGVQQEAQVKVSKSTFSSTPINLYKYSDNETLAVSPSLKETVDSLVKEHSANIGEFGELALARGVLAYKMAHKYNYSEGRSMARDLIRRSLVLDGDITTRALPPALIKDIIKIVWYPETFLPADSANFEKEVLSLANHPHNKGLNLRKYLDQGPHNAHLLPFNETLKVFRFCLQNNHRDSGIWLGRLLCAGSGQALQKLSETRMAIDEAKGTPKDKMPRLMLGILCGVAEYAVNVSGPDYIDRGVSFGTAFDVLHELGITLEDVHAMKNLFTYVSDEASDIATSTLRQLGEQLSNKKFRLSSQVKINEIMLHAVPLIKKSDFELPKPELKYPIVNWGISILEQEAFLLRKSDTDLARFKEHYKKIVKGLVKIAQRQPDWVKEEPRLIIPYMVAEFRKRLSYGSFASNTLFESMSKGGWNCINSALVICDSSSKLGMSPALVGVRNHALIMIDEDFYLDTTTQKEFSKREMLGTFGPINWIDTDGRKAGTSTLLDAGISSLNKSLVEAQRLLSRAAEFGCGSVLGETALGFLELARRKPDPTKALAIGASLFYENPNGDNLALLMERAAKLLNAHNLHKLMVMYQAQENPNDYARLQNMGAIDISSSRPEEITRGCQNLLSAMDIIVSDSSPSFAEESARQNAWNDMQIMLSNLHLGYQKLGHSVAALATLGCLLLLNPKDSKLRMHRVGLQATLRSPHGILCELDAILKLNPANKEAMEYKRILLANSKKK